MWRKVMPSFANYVRALLIVLTTGTVGLSKGSSKELAPLVYSSCNQRYITKRREFKLAH